MRNGGGKILFRKLMLGGLLGGGALAAAYAFLVEPLWVDWHEEQVEMPNLPQELDGFRICQLSDLHVSGGISAWQLSRIVEETNRRCFDLVVVTGDLLDDEAHDIESCVRLLAPLRARCGVIAILGGHDYKTGAADHLVEKLEAVGIRVLRNAMVNVGPPTQPLQVVGMDDNSLRRQNLNASLIGADLEKPLLLLMHSPDSIRVVAERGIPLALAGHTHGGQVCFPFYGPLVTMSDFGRRYARGRHVIDQTTLYVSRGLGSHHHVRFLARPEAVCLTLVQGR